MKTDLITNNLTQRIKNRLNTLYSTPAGTVPGDRAFGINQDLLDKPLQVAKALLTAEYISKTKKYFPDLTIDSVTITTSGSGTFIVKVVIK